MVEIKKKKRKNMLSNCRYEEVRSFPGQKRTIRMERTRRRSWEKCAKNKTYCFAAVYFAPENNIGYAIAQ